jgi:hypothetical protein
VLLSHPDVGAALNAARARVGGRRAEQALSAVVQNADGPRRAASAPNPRALMLRNAFNTGQHGVYCVRLALVLTPLRLPTRPGARRPPLLP